MTKNNKIIYLLLSIIFFVVLNAYFSELIVSQNFELAENPIFSFLYVRNEGAAFNIFEGHRIFLVAFSVFAIAGLLTYVIKHIDKNSTLYLFFSALLISGIFNNMIERILLGFVRDYIKLNFINFPVFNISDIFINIGVFGVVCLIAKNNYLKKDSK